MGARSSHKKRVQSFSRHSNNNNDDSYTHTRLSRMNQSILPPQYPSLFLHSVISPHPSTTSIHNNNNHNNNNYSGHDVMNDQQQQQQNVEYIYGICSDEQETKIAIQSSSPDIKLYALNHSMAFQGTLKGHSDQVHSIVYTQHSNHNTSAHSLASCSEDGSVCLFDTRVSNRPSHQVMMNMGPLYSIDIHKTNSHMLCVSGETTIQLRDMRRFNTSGASPSSSPASSSSSLLYTLDDIHTMMIRKVKFDSSTNRLFSSSDDGLVHVYDLNALSNNNNNNSNIDPEDTLSGVINANNGVHQFGLCGAQSNIMYTVNHMHELNLWSMDTMNQIATGVNRSHLESVYPSHVNGGGEGTSSSMGDDDDNMMMMMPGDDMAVGMSHNYLIDANYFASADSLYAYVGTARGTVVICKVVINNGVTSYVPMAQLQNGHVDNTVVRCMWASKSGQFDRVITGGEDGRICVWSTKEATTQSTSPVLDKQQQQQDLINDSAPSTTPSTTPSSRVQQHSARRNNGRNPYGGSGNNQRKRGGFNNKR